MTSTISSPTSIIGYFGHIIPCGIEDKSVTSLAHEICRKPDMAEVKTTLKGHIADLFGVEI